MLLCSGGAGACFHTVYCLAGLLLTGATIDAITAAWPLPCRTASPDASAALLRSAADPYLAYNDCQGQGTCADGVCTCEGGYGGGNCAITPDDYGGCTIHAGIQVSSLPAAPPHIWQQQQLLLLLLLLLFSVPAAGGAVDVWQCRS